jgi:hypothetical protein
MPTFGCCRRGLLGSWIACRAFTPQPTTRVAQTFACKRANHMPSGQGAATSHMLCLINHSTTVIPDSIADSSFTSGPHFSTAVIQQVHAVDSPQSYAPLLVVNSHTSFLRLVNISRNCIAFMLMPVYLNRHPWAWGLICCCLGLALLGTLTFSGDSVLPVGGQLTTHRNSLSTNRDLLQDISNSTLGVRFSP